MRGLDGRVTWQLHPHALEALRDRLLERGQTAHGGESSDLNPILDDSMKACADASPDAWPASALLRRLSPFLELLHLMMISDGTCDTSERQLLQGAARTLGGADLSFATIETLLTAFDANLAAEGPEARLEAIASLLCADRLDAEAAFTLTATMATADGTVDVQEHAVLRELAQVLGISNQRARELLQMRPA